MNCLWLAWPTQLFILSWRVTHTKTQKVSSHVNTQTNYYQKTSQEQFRYFLSLKCGLWHVPIFICACWSSTETDWPGEISLYCAESCVPVAYAHVSPACPAPVTSFGNQLEHMCVSDGIVYTCIIFVKRSEIESNNWHENTKGMTYNSFWNCSTVSIVGMCMKPNV